jgi:hypothetical protein
MLVDLRTDWVKQARSWFGAAGPFRQLRRAGSSPHAAQARERSRAAAGQLAQLQQQAGTWSTLAARDVLSAALTQPPADAVVTWSGMCAAVALLQVGQASAMVCQQPGRSFPRSAGAVAAARQQPAPDQATAAGEPVKPSPAQLRAHPAPRPVPRPAGGARPVQAQAPAGDAGGKGGHCCQRAGPGAHHARPAGRVRPLRPPGRALAAPLLQPDCRAGGRQRGGGGGGGGASDPERGGLRGIHPLSGAPSPALDGSCCSWSRAAWMWPCSGTAAPPARRPTALNAAKQQQPRRRGQPATNSCLTTARPRPAPVARAAATPMGSCLTTALPCPAQAPPAAAAAAAAATPPARLAAVVRRPATAGRCCCGRWEPCLWPSAVSGRVADAPACPRPYNLLAPADHHTRP